MKRFRRWLFNGLAALSLLLCITAISVLVWRGTYIKLFGNWHARNGTGVVLTIASGDIGVQRIHFFGNSPTLKPGSSTTSTVVNYKRREFWGISFSSADLQEDLNGPGGKVPGTRRFTLHQDDVEIPLVWVALVAAVLPAWWGIAHGRRWSARRKSISHGHCAKCGYDLRATPDRCPECGTAVPEPTGEKPTKLQFVLAHAFRIATWGGTVILAGLVSWHGIGSIAEYAGLTGHADFQMVLLVGVAILGSAPLGWLLGGFMIWPILGIIGNKINGAPFHEGDTVYILVGPHRGHTTAVYDVWPSRHEARVCLGDQAKKDVTDVFMWNEVCRVRHTNAASPP